jgi:sigma-B regulation protein RsbU (phosphoserine phosphatase)
MASARAALRGAIDAADAPHTAMDRANRLLCADIRDGSFMTLVVLMIDAGTGRLRWVNAAHDAPLVYHLGTQRFIPIVGSDIPLGIDPVWQYGQYEKTLPAGEFLVAIGTDGIWETEDRAGRAFGRQRYERLLRELADRPAREITAQILSAVDEFRGGTHPDDDVTLVVAKFTAPLAG